jgi:hypothetical protein
LICRFALIWRKKKGEKREKSENGGILTGSKSTLGLLMNVR